MSRILLLSTTTGYQLRSFGEAAAELGVELMFATDRCHSLDDPWRDGAVAVRFHEEEDSLSAILQAARSRPVDGVLPLGDRPVVLAARAASALGLRGNPPDAALASAHKRLTRERCAAAGLLVPGFRALTVDDDVRVRTEGLNYPVVVKPVGLSGSRGVIRADDPEELVAAFTRVAALLARPEIRALRTGTERDLIVEEFIHGREYAVEGLLTSGVFRPLALFDKPDPLDGPFFEETIYVTPSAAPEPMQQAIYDAVVQAVRALGLRHGAVHAECRVARAGVYVLEVAARPIGGLCSRVLRFQAQAGSGCSLEHVLLRHALGANLSGLAREEGGAAVMMVPIPRRGVFRRVGGEAEARRVKFVEDVRITAKPGGLLEPLPEAGRYLGFIFARAPQPADAEMAVRQAHGHLRFVIDTPLEVRSVPAGAPER